MTKAEEFKQKAAIARSKTPATLKYEALLEDIDQAAKAGMVALPQTKYTVEGLQYTRGMMGGAMLDYNKLYDEQEEIYDLLRQDDNQICASGKKNYTKALLYPNRDLQLLGEATLTPGKNALQLTLSDILGKEVNATYLLTIY